MKGQPTPPVGFDELYGASFAATYDRFYEWIINEFGERSHAEMGTFLMEQWATRPVPVRSVLEICCGTGLILQELASRGYEVSGLDRSSAMLARARAKLGPSVSLTQAELPDLPVDRTFDAVLCSAALNYLATEIDLASTFQAVTGVLGSGGSFVFDVLSRRGFLEWPGPGTSTMAADLGDYAFIWKKRRSGDDYIDLDYVQFAQQAGAGNNSYVAIREMHRLYVLDHALIRKVADAAGFVDIQVTDDYTSLPASTETLRETWIMVRD